ncbi:hypothetical protein [Niveibacterium sp. SC-1]|uniref:hypothetical protein n=1 Tax=Niveibacterium sp. SC-1 TaxID=3135646 RepID=UPI00311E82FF
MTRLSSLLAAARRPAALVASCVLAGSAHAAPADDGAFVGGYSHNTVDTVTQLLLLDDHSFCYAFVGGAVDRLIAGRWKRSSSGRSVRLQQVRAQSPLFPAWGQSAAQGTAGEVAFEFHGGSFAEARTPVFAVAANEARPTNFRPLFAPDKPSWADAYALPPMPRAGLRYFYVGDMEVDAQGWATRLRVTQYRLPRGNRVRLAFDDEQAEPLLDLQASLTGDVLFVNGERFGPREALEADEIKVARGRCIEPALAAASTRAKSAAAQTSGEGDDDAWGHDKELLKPLRSFFLAPGAMGGEPWFADKP